MKPHWPTVPLGEVLRERQETPSADALASGKIRIVAKIGFNDGAIQLRADGETKTGMILIRPGDLVVSGINAGKGAIAIYGEENDAPVAATIHYGAYIPNKDRVDVRFLWWLLRSGTFRELLLEYVPGGIKTELKAKRLLPIPVPLPNLPEQRRIVARIEQLAAQIEEARRLRHQATEEIDALIGSERARVFEKIPASNNKRFEDVAVLERGKFSHRPRNEPRFFGGDHPWIQIGEIEASDKFIRTHTETLNDDGLAISRKFPKGTLLVSIAATIGAVGILDFDCCVPDSIVAITPKPGLDSEYIYHYLGYVRSHLERVAPQSAQKNINLRILTELPVPAPPLPEQRRIVGYLDGLAGQVAALARL
jgi:type I restriction enzyme S subunit